jgi:hypothetical protein
MRSLLASSVAATITIWWLPLMLSSSSDWPNRAAKSVTRLR